MKVRKGRSERHRIEYLEVTIEVHAEKYRMLENYLKSRGMDFEMYVGRILENFKRIPPLFELDTKFTFGKYRLRSFRDVASQDPGYIDFCISNVEGFALHPTAEGYLAEVKRHIEKTRTGK